MALLTWTVTCAVTVVYAGELGVNSAVAETVPALGTVEPAGGAIDHVPPTGVPVVGSTTLPPLNVTLESGAP